MFVLSELWNDFKCRFGFVMLELMIGIGMFAAGLVTVVYVLLKVMVAPLWIVWKLVDVVCTRGRRKEAKVIDRYLGK